MPRVPDVLGVFAVSFVLDQESLPLGVFAAANHYRRPNVSIDERRAFPSVDALPPKSDSELTSDERLIEVVNLLKRLVSSL